MPHQAVPFVRQQVHVQHVRVLVIPLHHRTVDAKRVVIDPLVVGVQEHTHIGALVRGMLAHLFIALEEGGTPMPMGM